MSLQECQQSLLASNLQISLRSSVGLLQDENRGILFLRVKMIGQNLSEGEKECLSFTEDAVLDHSEKSLNQTQQPLERAIKYENVQQAECIYQPWVPRPSEYVDVQVLFAQAYKKIRTINTVVDKEKGAVEKLKRLPIRQLYIRYLKQYKVCQQLVIFSWRNLYPVYIRSTQLFSRKRIFKRWRSLTKLRDYVNNSGSQITLLREPETVETPAPKVIPSEDQKLLVSPHVSYAFPEIYIATICNALISGGTNFVLTEAQIICHDLYNFERDFTSEELHGRLLIEPKLMRARWLMCDDFPEVLPVAATFVDACAFNYEHWVTEVLPRVAAFCSCDQFKDVPLIVDAGLHANIMESLFLVTGGEREIVLLPIGRAIKVRTLYVTSVAGYVPFERRNNKIAGHSHGLCSPWAFGLVRQHLFKFVESSPRRKWPKKIYLRRNSDVRKIVNSSEIEKLLINDGYKIYETEKMSFLDQVRLFSNIKFLVGSSGAALANIIFVSSDCQITVLMGTHPDTSYWYWQNMACASGNSVNYILGQRIRGNGIHADFEIDVNKLVQGLR